MISAVFDVLRPFLSLCFLATCVFVLAKIADGFATWDERRIRARHARRLFEGNRQPRDGREHRAAPVVSGQENARHTA